MDFPVWPLDACTATTIISGGRFCNGGKAKKEERRTNKQAMKERNEREGERKEGGREEGKEEGRRKRFLCTLWFTGALFLSNITRLEVLIFICLFLCFVALV